VTLKIRTLTPEEADAVAAAPRQGDYLRLLQSLTAYRAVLVEESNPFRREKIAYRLRRTAQQNGIAAEIVNAGSHGGVMVRLVAGAEVERPSLPGSSSPVGAPSATNSDGGLASESGQPEVVVPRTEPVVDHSGQALATTDEPYPYCCDRCGYEAAGPKSLETHERYQHGAGLRKVTP